MRNLVIWPAGWGSHPPNCAGCGTNLKDGTIISVDDYYMNQPQTYSYTIKCARCSIVDMITDPSLPNRQLKTLIKETIKEIMREEASNPNGTFSP